MRYGIETSLPRSERAQFNECFGPWIFTVMAINEATGLTVTDCCSVAHAGRALRLANALEAARIDFISGITASELRDLAAPLLPAHQKAYEDAIRGLKYTDYLESGEWYDMRTIAHALAAGRCQVCNGDKQLEVHHRTYERRGFELPSDLTVLCRRCHGGHHRRNP